LRWLYFGEYIMENDAENADIDSKEVKSVINEETEESGWAEKRRRQAQCREDLRAGRRTLESVRFIPKELVAS
jgi:hypothetical protein